MGTAPAGLIEHLRHMTAVQARTNRRPRGGTPLFNPAFRHTFEADLAGLVTSQCVHCWGWYDDVRHR